MPDVRGLLADPEFNALPMERRQAILAQINPQLAAEYAGSVQDSGPSMPHGQIPTSGAPAAGATMDVLRGAGNEALDIFGGLGQATDKLLSKLGGMEPQTEAFQTFRRPLQPKNTGEQVGGGLMELLSFIGPGLGIKAATLPAALLREGVTSGLAATAQEGDVNQNVAGAAGLGMAGPVMGKGMGLVGSKFESGARDTLARLLKPSSSPKAHKAAVKGIDTLMEEGGFRAGSLDQLGSRMGGRAAASEAERTAAESAASGNMVDIGPIRDRLTALRDALTVKGTSSVVHEGLRAQYDDLLSTLGDIEAQAGQGGLVARDTLVSLKQQLDEVYKTADPNSPTRRAVKKFGDTVRGELDIDSPEIAGINRKLSGELSAKETIDSAARRGFGKSAGQAGETSALRAGAGLAVRMGGGAATGYYVGGQSGTGAALGATAAGVAPYALMRLMNSTRWLTTSAAIKRTLSSLLQSGEVETANRLAGEILASTVPEGPGELDNPLEQQLRGVEADKFQLEYNR